uniref:Uncharacterized protein n=1 Tax=Panagrolaimus davidi TaxID=227884 RepID=A0A914Q3I3_9BILA
MITIFQLVGAIFSVLVMEELAHLKAIGAGAVAILVLSNAFYFMISKSVKHKIVFDRNAMVFLMIDFGIQGAKVFLYSTSPKKASISDAIKMFGYAAGPLVSLIIPLVCSKDCDIILKRIPSWLPKLTKGVLTVSGYEEVEFDRKCVPFSVKGHIFHQNVHLCVGQPSTLDITFETKYAADRCKVILVTAFQSQLQTVSNCFCFNV